MIARGNSEIYPINSIIHVGPQYPTLRVCRVARSQAGIIWTDVVLLICDSDTFVKGWDINTAWRASERANDISQV
jgi:hypothetical protein